MKVSPYGEEESESETTASRVLTLSAETQELQPDADLIRLLREDRVPQIRSQFSTFRDEILNYEPIHFLGVSSLYVLVWSSGASIEKKKGYQIEPADLEALQALFLTSSPKPGLLPATGDFGEIWERLRNQHFALIVSSPLDFLAQEKALLAGGIRLHSAYYRNPYGREFFERMMLSIAKEFDRRQSPPGQSLYSFFQFLIQLLDKIQHRFSDATNRLVRSIQGRKEEVLLLAAVGIKQLLRQPAF